MGAAMTYEVIELRVFKDLRLVKIRSSPLLHQKGRSKLALPARASQNPIHPGIAGSAGGRRESRRGIYKRKLHNDLCFLYINIGNEREPVARSVILPVA